MEGPANTVSYFVAGYVVIFGIMAFYLGSLIVRWRNLKQDEAMLQQVGEKESDQG